MKKGDFHIHSNHSDGDLSIKTLIDEYSKKNFDILSITDHDTFDGCEEAVDYGKEKGIYVIPGVELSTKYNGESIHILGYFKHTPKKELLDFVNSKKESRIQRCYDICEKLEEHYSIKINAENVLKKHSGSISRNHIADEIIAKGYFENKEEVFDKCLNSKGKAYIPSSELPLKDGIELIRRNGGMVVLAHPVLIVKNDVLEILDLFEFDGIEAIYSSNKEKDTINLVNLAHEKKLIITSGSDFHSLEKLSLRGCEFGEINLEEERIQIFLNKLNEK